MMEHIHVWTTLTERSSSGSESQSSWRMGSKERNSSSRRSNDRPVSADGHKESGSEGALNRSSSERQRASVARRKRREKSMLNDRRAQLTYAIATAGLSMLFLVTRRTTFLLNFLALAGPALLFAVCDLVARSSLRKKDVLLEQLYAVTYACAAAGMGAVPFGDFTLRGLNFVGAFINGFTLIIAEHHFKGTDYKLSTLEEFRGVFCGVLTSFVGVIYFAVQQSILDGLWYYISSLVGGVIATELGLRLGGYFSEELELEPRYQARLSVLSNWIPYVCSYIATLAFLTVPVQEKLGMVSSFSFSTMGAFAGNIGTISSDNLVQDLFSNVSAVIMAGVSMVVCGRWAGPVKLGELLCHPKMQGEFANSFCGAVSTFCGTSMAGHQLVKSVLPEDVLEDVYLNHNLLGSNALRVIEPPVDESENLAEDQQHLVRLRFGGRVAADASLLIVGFIFSRLA